jgi:hypothetical protein
MTRNKTPHSNKTAHKTTQAIKDTLHKMNTMQIRFTTARIQLQKKSGREPQRAWRQDKLIGGKPPVVK